MATTAQTLSELVAAAFREVAMDQVVQDMENAAKFATKSEVAGQGRSAVAIEQLIALYNGYHGTNLDYRDYLDQTSADVENALYALVNGYNGVQNV